MGQVEHSEKDAKLSYFDTGIPSCCTKSKGYVVLRGIYGNMACCSRNSNTLHPQRPAKALVGPVILVPGTLSFNSRLNSSSGLVVPLVVCLDTALDIQ